MNTELYIPTASPLADYVTAIWEVKGRQDVSELILPQGVTEIIFSFGERIEGIMPFSKTPLHTPRCFVQGMQTHTIVADYKGQQHLLGIRLHPHHVQSLLGIQPAEIKNHLIDLAMLNPLFDQLWHRLAELNSFHKRVLVLEQELPLVSTNSCPRSRLLSELFLSDQQDPFQSVDLLAKEVCYSTRQLNRIVQDIFGICAEELTTYKKFVNAVRLIHSEQDSLTGIAYRSGFYDQAHFCRVFKSFAGMTANQYRKQKSDLPFHIFSN